MKDFFENFLENFTLSLAFFGFILDLSSNLFIMKTFIKTDGDVKSKKLRREFKSLVCIPSKLPLNQLLKLTPFLEDNKED